MENCDTYERNTTIPFFLLLAANMFKKKEGKKVLDYRAAALGIHDKTSLKPRCSLADQLQIYPM